MANWNKEWGDSYYLKIKSDPEKYAKYLERKRISSKKRYKPKKPQGFIPRDKKEMGREWYLKNNESVKARAKKWKTENKEKVAISEKKGRVKRLPQLREYWKKLRQDPRKRLLFNMRNRLCSATKGVCYSESTKELLGCSMHDFRYHLESKFTQGMSWDNYGKWHVDHKIPCSFFDLSIKEERERCFNYRNLQPLWAIDNFIKNDKIL